MPPHTTVSVLMSVHNAERYLQQAIESILRQTYDTFEFVIVNDGSTDGTQSILRYYATLDSRVRIINQKNYGLPAALNNGLEKCRSELVARMDADDISHPRRLSVQAHYMTQHPDVAVLGCQVQMITADGNRMRRWSPPTNAPSAAWRLILGNTLPHPGVMFRRDAVQSVGGYAIGLSSAQDYDLWCRMVQAGLRITNLPDCLLNYRIHASQTSAVHMATQQRNATQIALSLVRWLLDGNVPMAGVVALRRLCDHELGRLTHSPSEIKEGLGLMRRVVRAVDTSYSRKEGHNARQLFMRKLIRAAAWSMLRFDPAALALLSAARQIQQYDSAVD